MRSRLAAIPLLAAACATNETDITVGVYSALPFAEDSALRAVCIDVESRGLPVQRVVAAVQAGVPPRHLFDFRVVPRDENLSNPVTVRVYGRTRVGCSMGVELARTTRVVRFIPNERTRETVVLGDADPPQPDAGVDAPRPDVPQPPLDIPTGGCPAGQALCGGACTNPRIDPRNCGGCGMVCGDSTFCVNGACVCPTGQYLCDGRRCTDPRFDPDWCGATSCGGRCPTVANGTRLCQLGRCVYTCNDGYEPVGGMCMHCGLAGEPGCDRPVPCNAGYQVCDGLCRDTATDRAHCGACGMSCGAQRCVSGACRP